MTTFSCDPRVSVADHSLTPPTEQAADRRTWITRGGNFVVEVSQVRAGAVLERQAQDQPDEYMVLLADVPAHLQAGHESSDARADSLVIMPPGHSRVTVQGDGTVMRVFSCEAKDRLSKAANQAPYASTRPDLAPLVPWPEPVGGYRLRVYHMPDYEKAGDKMRVFRSRSLMINVLTRREKAREVREMSPHSHEDFEQASTVVWGTFQHHLRHPWGKDMTRWLPDEHVHVGAPSVTVIPPHVIHTSNNLGDVPAWLIDVFAPPRVDFSSRPGFVCNEHDYPMPKDLKP